MMTKKLVLQGGKGTPRSEINGSHGKSSITLEVTD